MHACPRNGVPYVASTVLAAPRIAAGASPLLRSPLLTFDVGRARLCWAFVASDCAAFSPPPQDTGSLPGAVFPRHHVSATTATAESDTGTTPRTPGAPL